MYPIGVISRDRHVERVAHLLRENPVVAILGARQVGKTTLARQVAKRRGGAVTWLDLEEDQTTRALEERTLVLERRRGLVVLDEVQRLPEVFRQLRVLADRSPLPARFLVLGSAAPELLRQASESLAGRIAFHELPGFMLDEVGPERADALWVRGGFPRSFLARTEADSRDWRDDFISTFLGRDVPAFGVGTPPATLRRFWSMLAHYHGQTWNGAELARALGLSESSVRRHLDVLTSTVVVRQLQPWHENLAKRQVKSPKVYVSDTGLLHQLLQVADRDALDLHPKVGASWEGFGLQTVVRALDLRPHECFFWATHGGAELDLLVMRGRERRGFEFKRTTTPSLTTSMRVAMEDLRLDRLDVIHGGTHVLELGPKVRAIPLGQIFEALAPDVARVRRVTRKSSRASPARRK